MKTKILSRWFGHTDGTQKVNQSQLCEGLSVLIVDDSRTQLYAMDKLLKAEGVKTHTAENGRQAILMARHIKPDLILMDIVMPEINGFQATRYLSRQPETAHIPIIIVSGSDQESDKVWGIKLGAKDYLQKPASRDELLKKISHWTAKAGVKKSQPVQDTGKSQSDSWVEAV